MANPRNYQTAEGFYDADGTFHAGKTRSEVVGASRPTQPTNPVGALSQAIVQRQAIKEIGKAVSGEAAKEVAKEGAKEAAVQATPSIASNFGSMGFAPQAGVVAGVGVSALDAKNLLEGKKDNSIAGKAGRAQNAINTGGLSEVARAFGFGSQGRDYRKESLDRVQSLSDRGITTHDFGDTSGYGVKTKEGRVDPKTLGAEDVWGLPAFYERYGNDWLGKFTEEERRAIAQQAVDSGAVIYKDNQHDIDWSKVQGAPEAVAIPAASNKPFVYTRPETNSNAPYNQAAVDEAIRKFDEQNRR